jgi:hypothetical protein
MPFTLNREMHGPRDQGWRFNVTRTREGSNVQELIEQTLPYGLVVEIFREAVGDVPANGLGYDDVVQHWDALEPRLRAEIARVLPADRA